MVEKTMHFIFSINLFILHRGYIYKGYSQNY